MDRASYTVKPSAAARRRLEAAVEETFRPTVLKMALQFLARPIPLYQGAIGAAFALALAALIPLLAHANDNGAQAPVASERIDSARPAPASLGLY